MNPLDLDQAATVGENGAAVPVDDEEIVRVPDDLTEDALALAFTHRHADDLRYVHDWGKWLRWDGARWAPERTLAVYDLARRLTRDVGATVDQARVLAKVQSAATVAAIVTLARADRTHARVTEDFDADPWLLNTPAGTVDLHSGAMGPHRRADGLTKVTPVAPGDHASPVWRACLRTWTGDDPELEGFLQPGRRRRLALARLAEPPDPAPGGSPDRPAGAPPARRR
jgi:putative DNA primase/helicase